MIGEFWFLLRAVSHLRIFSLVVTIHLLYLCLWGFLSVIDVVLVGDSFARTLLSKNRLYSWSMGFHLE